MNEVNNKIKDALSEKFNIKIIYQKEMEEFRLSDSFENKAKIAADLVDGLKNKKIIIYGIGATGTQLTLAFQRYGVTPEFYIDRRWEQITEFFGRRVCSAEELSKLDVSEVCLVIAVNSEIVKSFDEDIYMNIYNNAKDIPVISNGMSLASIISYVNCYNKFKNKEKFDIVDCLNCGAESQGCSIYNEYLKLIAVGRKVVSIKPSKKFDWFGCIMGQTCTLKCKHCCECVPYFKERRFSKATEIIEDCRKIAASCEFLRYIDLVGGEPLLHPEFKKIIEGLLTVENVGFIKVFTNGTIVPNDEVLELFKNPRLVLTMSNYVGQVEGKLLDNILLFRAKLKEKNIKYICSDTKSWTDWGGFEMRNKTEEELVNDFRDCFDANCHKLFEGKIYRCPHQYAGVTLGDLELIDGEYVDVKKLNYDELGQALDDLKGIKYVDACKRCSMPYDAPEVPAGVQLH